MTQMDTDASKQPITDKEREKVGNIVRTQTTNSNKNEPKDTFLVFDDVLADNPSKNCSNLNQVFFNGRHYNLRISD